jgi:hypothetical protein
MIRLSLDYRVLCMDDESRSQDGALDGVLTAIFEPSGLMPSRRPIGVKFGVWTVVESKNILHASSMNSGYCIALLRIPKLDRNTSSSALFLDRVENIFRQLSVCIRTVNLKKWLWSLSIER